MPSTTTTTYLHSSRQELNSRLGGRLDGGAWVGVGVKERQGEGASAGGEGAGRKPAWREGAAASLLPPKLRTDWGSDWSMGGRDSGEIEHRTEREPIF